MAVAIDELIAIMKDEKLLDGCGETRDGVAHLCITFHESQRFPRPISDKKIELLLKINAKTVWIHWKHFSTAWTRGC
jgi:hypothetical protein